MGDKVRLLLACSDPDCRKHLSNTLDQEFETIHATNVAESSSLLAQEPVSVIFCEDRLPGGGCSCLLNEIKRSGTITPVVVLSRTGDWEEYLAVLRLGAFDMVIPPYERLAIQTAAYGALQESRVSRGARAVETLPRIAPTGPLRAVPRAAKVRAYAAAGARSAIPVERRPALERAKNVIPSPAENRQSEKERSSMRESFAESQGKVHQERLPRECEGSSGPSSEMGGLTP